MSSDKPRRAEAAGACELLTQQRASVARRILTNSPRHGRAIAAVPLYMRRHCSIDVLEWWQKFGRVLAKD